MPAASNLSTLGELLGRAARLLGWLGLAFLALGCSRAHASNPRWVTGPPYFNQQQPGIPVIWYTRTPQYFTDPGDLSPYVNHAAADALVAAAAAVWNVPSADFTVTQGGTLAEHVSSANTYADPNGIVLPADVGAGNYSSVQIAVVYDSDGSITDLLLGAGASSPMECPHYGVTESVDSISQAGFIQHAIIVLNGRCTGPAPEQQLQLQYQLQRVFGRVYGVGWSQTNDNVFTRTPAPTYEQAQHWPIMHPIDIVCGPYTYQCLPDPFTLRDDDIAAITGLYRLGYSPQLGWIGFNQVLPGKVPSYNTASRGNGNVLFPNGQGMQGVNVVIQRTPMYSPLAEPWYESSAVSGYAYRQISPNPVTGAGADIPASMGSTDPGYEGHFDFPWIPLLSSADAWVNVQITWEPINPLYTGAHAVGPYVSSAVTPSGTPSQMFAYGLRASPNFSSTADLSFFANGATTACTASPDGAETTPAPAPATGWWTDTLCGYNHSAWTAFTAAAGHTATVEVTALDEDGLASTSKALPLLGLWNAGDPAGLPPTVGHTAAAFNTIALGTSALAVNGSQAGSFRLALADARGDGRPDYIYRARILYAASVQPATVSQAGGRITIGGMGFRPGLRVLVNGIPARVSSATANSLTAIAPAVDAFPAAPAGAVDIQVQDTQTGGSSTFTGALSYATIAGEILSLVSAPSGAVQSGVSAGPFSVRLLLNDGVTPVAGIPIAFAATGAAVVLSGCSGSPCIALTDTSGLASVSVTPAGFGSVTLAASAAGATQSATFTAVSRGITSAQPNLYLAAGAAFTWTLQAALRENNSPAGGVTVAWTGSSGLSIVSAAGQSSTGGAAAAFAAAGPLAAGVQASAQACAWTTQTATGPCTAFTAIGVAPSELHLALRSGDGQSIALNDTFAPVVAQVVDDAGHPVAGALVSVHQSVDQVQMPCPTHGACPIPQTLGSSSATLTSDAAGIVTATPLQVRGEAEITHMALACGTAAFVSLSLTQGP